MVVQLQWRTIADHGSLWARLLEERRRVFVDEKRWTLNVADKMEFDCYDRPDAHYLIAVSDDTITGFLRLLQTTSVARYGDNTLTYMIRDASLGLLDDIPSEVADYVPVENCCWEVSRFHAKSARATAELYSATREFLQNKGGKSLVALMRPALARRLKPTAGSMDLLGPVLEIENEACGAYYWQAT